MDSSRDEALLHFRKWRDDRPQPEVALLLDGTEALIKARGVIVEAGADVVLESASFRARFSLEEVERFRYEETREAPSWSRENAEATFVCLLECEFADDSRCVFFELAVE